MDEFSSGYISDRTVLRWTARWVSGGAGAALHVVPDSCPRAGAESQAVGLCRTNLSKQDIKPTPAPPALDALQGLRRQPPPPPPTPPGPPLDVRLMRTAEGPQGD
eukprot:COSAG02_NODE_425_length_22574_cov_29.550300_8_plen_105_part_00